jgi:hypothetical protein
MPVPHTIVYYSNLLLNQDVLSKINPDNGVEAIKGMDATLTSLLAVTEWSVF